MINIALIDNNNFGNCEILCEKETVFKIVHLNIQCIRNKYEELDLFCLNKEYNILCLTEHWLLPGETPYLEGYYIANIFHRKTFIHGGSLIFVKNSITCKKIKTIDDLAIDKDFECCAIQVNDNNFTNIIVICVYRSPDSDFDHFINRLESSLSYVQSHYTCCEVILCGDFNVNFMINSIKRENVLDILNCHNIDITIRQPTRITSSSSTCIDNICTSINSNKYTSHIINPQISDHLAQLIEINNVSLDLNIRRYSRDVTTINIQYFKYLLSKENLAIIYHKTSVDEGFDYFIDLIIHNSNIAFPYVDKKKIDKPDNGWITKGIINSSKKLKN